MYFSYKPYVSAAERRKKAQKAAAKVSKNGEKLAPIFLDGRTIAKTFWGKSWCSHLESFSDYENRLPRGRTYVRNGSVIHLKIETGKIEALVQGSSLYKVKIEIDSVENKKWQEIVKECSGKIDSVIELLQGKLSSSVMNIITDQQKGLFPQPKEISLNCSCPDWADMCKHVAAVLYGVGARLDDQPELLFKLRHVDHFDLIDQATFKAPTKSAKDTQSIDDQDLSSLFGIEIDSESPAKEDTGKKLTIAFGHGSTETPKISKPSTAQSKKIKPTKSARKDRVAAKEKHSSSKNQNTKNKVTNNKSRPKRIKNGSSKNKK